MADMVVIDRQSIVLFGGMLVPGIKGLEKCWILEVLGDGCLLKVRRLTGSEQRSGAYERSGVTEIGKSANRGWKLRPSWKRRL